MSVYKYFLKAAWQEDYDEVTREQFIAAERAAGFRPRGGGDGLATAGFSADNVSGKIEIEVVPDEDQVRGASIKEKLREAHQELLDQADQDIDRALRDIEVALRASLEPNEDQEEGA